MGEIIKLNDGLYDYVLPNPPKDETKILNYNLPKEHQIWRRPAIADVTKMNIRDMVAYIDQMDERFYEGQWMMIGGELIWITGMHWDFLVMNKFDFGYPLYLEQQRFDFYFRDLVRKDLHCYGKAILKCRRCGMTTEEITEAIYTLLEDENSNIGLQSNERTKCLVTLLRPLIQAYLSRPAWMRGRFYAPGGKKPRNSLELISGRVDILHDDDDDYLGGTVLPYQTTAAAMDGTKKRFIVQDESFKWIACSPMETMDINKKCVVEYGIKGKIDVLSTMGDSDDQVDAVKEGCQIIYDSNPMVRDPNGRTTSGLYEWFVGAIHSADIPEEYRDPAYTKFGKINKDRAEQYVISEVEKYPKDSKQRVFAMRRLPLEKKHGLMAAADKMYFPIIRIDERLHELSSMPRGKKPYVVGNLIEGIGGRIAFEPDEGGKWMVSIMPYISEEKGINLSNRFRFHNGKYYPPVNVEYIIGYDPIRYKTKNTTSSHLSLAAGIIFKKFDYYNTGIINEFAALYLDRPEDPKEAHREMIKACRFWGAKCNAERQVETTEDEFDENGMGSFLMRDEKGIFGLWTTDKTIENGVHKMASKFAVPKNDIDKDQVAIYPFEAGLIDYKNFDMGNSRKSHITMATIMAEFGLDNLFFTNQMDNSTTSLLQAAKQIFPKRA